MLAEARRRGATFTDTVTLGRQNLSLRDRELDHILREAGLSRSDLHWSGDAWSGIADDLLVELLGIERLVSLDASEYEGSSLVHDLNEPVPPELHEAFDAVVDTGTLEHVFNVAVAFGNCMRMLKVGGRIFSLTPANNHCGHGFYQFSPELFFRLYSRANGFELERCLAVAHPFPGIELSARRTVYTVRDPADLGTRVGLVSRGPVYLFVQAVKRESVEPLASFPQQSDYAAAWKAATRPDSRTEYRPSLGEAAARSIWKMHASLPPALARPLLGIFQRFYRDTFRNRKAYSRWSGRDDSFHA